MVNSGATSTLVRLHTVQVPLSKNLLEENFFETEGQLRDRCSLNIQRFEHRQQARNPGDRHSGEEGNNSRVKWISFAANIPDSSTPDDSDRMDSSPFFFFAGSEGDLDDGQPAGAPPLTFPGFLVLR